MASGHHVTDPENSFLHVEIQKWVSWKWGGEREGCRQGDGVTAAKGGVQRTVGDRKDICCVCRHRFEQFIE